MTFEYIAPAGAMLHVDAATRRDGTPVVELSAADGGQFTTVQLPVDRVEEVIAGIRDAARQTTGQADTEPETVPTPEEGIEDARKAMQHVLQLFLDRVPRDELDAETMADSLADALSDGLTELYRTAARAETAGAAPGVGQPDPTTADDPTPLRWGLGDVLHGDDDTVIVCLSGPAPDRAPYWLELDPERAAALRRDLTGLDAIEPQDHPGADLYVRLRKAGEEHNAAQELIYAHARMAVRQHTALNGDVPAVGQPAEAQDADEARPPRTTWRVEGYDADEWNAVSCTFHRSEDAHARKRVSQRYPDMPTRVVRETTTWTVEDES